MSKNSAILLAGGSGSRLGEKKNKCLVRLGERPMICYSLDKLEANELISEVIIVSRKADMEKIRKIVKAGAYNKVRDIVAGGDSRQQSVKNGFEAVRWEAGDMVVIHNSANPFFIDKELGEVIEAARRNGAAAVASAAKDTIKEVLEGKVVRTLERERLVQMQTPQGIRADLFQKALYQAAKDGFEGTDDVSLVEHLGKEVEIVAAAENNFKITTQADLERAELLVRGNKLAGKEDCRTQNYDEAIEAMGALRIGLGQDSHRLDFTKKGMAIGGVFLAEESAFEANSDGDVVLHALFNAISSAQGGGSISAMADEMCLGKGIKDSSEYLKALLGRYHGCLAILNVAISLECQRPKIEPIIPEMKRKLATLLGIDEDCIGITATSGEGLSAFGRGEGVQCIVTVLMKVMKQ